MTQFARNGCKTAIWSVSNFGDQSLGIERKVKDDGQNIKLGHLNIQKR